MGTMGGVIQGRKGQQRVPSGAAILWRVDAVEREVTWT